jgi:hypothetical protein
MIQFIVYFVLISILISIFIIKELIMMKKEIKQKQPLFVGKFYLN